MAIYAIGDLQGCHDELMALLDKIDFQPGADQIWLTGDLVNRGPKSLATLRTLKALGDAVVTVLGNHDLHLLAVAHGISRTKHLDTFQDILNAKDRDDLLHWLRHRPFMVERDSTYLVHAGLAPQWSFEDAKGLAGEVESILQSDQFDVFLWHMYGNLPDVWSEDLKGWDRYRFITNCFTRMRYVDRNGRLDLIEKGPPEKAGKALIPWFQHPMSQNRGGEIIFGHWSSLGLHLEDGFKGLDTGCLWGGPLTAYTLGSGVLTQVKSTRPQMFGLAD